MTEAELFSRWIAVLRAKAKEYEHGTGEVVSPSLDGVCWEMESYLAGRDMGSKATLDLAPFEGIDG